jgi:hypothetical protein
MKHLKNNFLLIILLDLKKTHVNLKDYRVVVEHDHLCQNRDQVTIIIFF